jgi:hypothetical protein
MTFRTGTGCGNCYPIPVRADPRAEQKHGQTKDPLTTWASERQHDGESYGPARRDLLLCARTAELYLVRVKSAQHGRLP